MNRAERTPSTQPVDYTGIPYRDADGDVAYIAPDGTAWKQPVPDDETAESLGVAGQEVFPEGWTVSDDASGA